MIRRLAFAWVMLTASAFAQCGPPAYNCSQTGTFNAGTIATIFNATSPTTTTCSGGCVNSVAHDTTINPYWLDPYIRVTDGTSACQGGAQGLSLSSSPSGGDNDNTWSLNDDYLLVVTTGGIGCILHLNLSGLVPQVINTGRPQITCSGAFSFSRVTDSRYYCRSTLTNIQQCDIVNDATANCTNLVDVGAAGICPGLPQPFLSSCSPSCSGTIMTVTANDDEFLFSLSNAGVQNTATWSLAWSRTKGCTVADNVTGNEWNYCTGGSCNTGNTPSGTLSGCYGASTTNGIHDALGSLDGNYLYNTMHNANLWTACSGATASGTYQVWQVGTTGTVLCDGRAPGSGGTGCVDHSSVGYSHTASNVFTGAVIRTNSATGTIIEFGPAYSPLLEDWHSAWPYGTGADNYPLLIGTDLVSMANGGPLAPVYQHNEIMACTTTTTTAPYCVFRRFGHTFSCGNGASTCPGGGDSYFAAYDSIMNCSNDGKYCALSSTMLNSLGNDANSNPRMDVFVIALDGGSPPAPIRIPMLFADLAGRALN